MLRSSFLLVLIGCLLASCKTTQVVFDLNKSIAASYFLEEIPLSIQEQEMLPKPPEFQAPEIYNTHFSQQFAEADNVIVKALLHETGKTKPVKYLAPLYGVREELYLIKLTTTDNRNSYFVYMSVWYDDSQDPPAQTGFGPAYWGKWDEGHSTITFKKGLVMKSSDQGLYLSPMRNGRQFFFVLDAKDKSNIVIQRIVLTEKNKIGADKPYVFIVKGTKLDKLVFAKK